MSCKSALYTAMQTPTAVAVDGVIPLGSLIRRYGCDITLNGNAVNIVGKGYYDVDTSITVAPTAAGTVTATLYKDGVAVPGADAGADWRGIDRQQRRPARAAHLICDRTSKSLNFLIS